MDYGADKNENALEESGIQQHQFYDLVICFCCATAAAILIAFLKKPIGGIRAEEYLELAKTLYTTGNYESILRPPGYYGFLSLIIAIDESILRGNYQAVIITQSILHGITTVIIREELGWKANNQGSQLLALSYGLSSVALINTGFYHYDTLHIFLLVLSAASIRRAHRYSSWLYTLSAGVVLGVL